MHRARSQAIRSLVAILVTTIMIVASGAPVLAQQGAEIQVTDSEDEADQPDVAIDSAGNVHIAYVDEDVASNDEIWYTMLDNNGNTLIDDTLISDDDEDKSKRPAIVVDSADMVHIVWQDKRDWPYSSGGGEIYYTKLDPSLDDQDGDDASEPAITVEDDTRLTDLSEGLGEWEGYIGHPRIAIDSNDNIHIVFKSYDVGIYYMQIDDDGVINVAPILLKDLSWSGAWRTSVSVAVDSDNNAHITWNDYEDTSDYETYYMMLDGSDGSTLIDATLITPDDGERSKRQSIVVDFEDKVHIIWQDKRDLTEWWQNEIYYTKLDPSLDDQDGDDASEPAITVIDDTALTPDDGDKSYHPTSAISCGRYINITWIEDNTDDLHFMILDTDGNTEVADVALTTAGYVTTYTLWTLAYMDVDDTGKVHIVWCDERTGYYEVWYTTYQGPPHPIDEEPPDDIEVGGDVSPVNRLALLAPWMALAVVIIAGATIAVRRRRTQS